MIEIVMKVDDEFWDNITQLTVFKEQKEKIHCKDCKYYESDNCEHGHCRMYFFNRGDIGLDGVMPMPMNSDDFCSKGERRDEKRR